MPMALPAACAFSGALSVFGAKALGNYFFVP
jgi:hypothetical protein